MVMVTIQSGARMSVDQKYSVVATGAITLKLDDSALVYKNSNIIVDYETRIRQ